MSSSNQTYSSRSSPRTEERQSSSSLSSFSSTSSAPRTPFSSGSDHIATTASSQPNGTISRNTDVSNMLLPQIAVTALTCQPTADNFHRIDMLVKALDYVVEWLGKEGSLGGGGAARVGRRSFERDIEERKQRMLMLVCLRVQKERLRGLWRYKGNQERFGREVKDIVKRLAEYAGGD